MFLAEFYCKKCDKVFEDLVSSSTTEETECSCGDSVGKILSAARVGLYTNPKSETTANALKKRSFDNSVSDARKNTDQFAKRLGGTPKTQSKWNIRSSNKVK